MACVSRERCVVVVVVVVAKVAKVVAKVVATVVVYSNTKKKGVVVFVVR